MDLIHDAKTNYYVNSEEEELTFDSRKEEINHGQSGIWNLLQKLNSILIARNEGIIPSLGNKMNKSTMVAIVRDLGNKAVV